MKRKLLERWMVVCAAIVLGAGCDARGASTADGEMKLAIYEVPGGSARELANALSKVLWKGDKGEGSWTGRVSVAPDGRLLVLATPSIQEGVRAMVEAAGKAPRTGPVP